MKVRIVCGMGVLAAALSAAAYASEPHVSSPIIEEIIVTAKRPQLEEIVVTAKRRQIEEIIVTAPRPRALLSAESKLERAAADDAETLLKEAAERQRLF